MVSQLFPLPGSKADRKYDRTLYPQLSATAICEGFMGSAARSIRYNHLTTYLGEINPAQRAVALAIRNDKNPYPCRYANAYMGACNDFWHGIHSSYKDLVLSYSGKKKAQTLLRADQPELCDQLTRHWRKIAAELFQEIVNGSESPIMAGIYAFCIRACFGNVMRLNPKGTHFNVTWHVDKLSNAMVYSPHEWIEELQAIKWNPNVYGCWEDAIAAVPDPEKCYLLLDPPYLCDAETEKMTPCYLDHSVTTKSGMMTVFNLAVDSLKAGLERGFPVISVCNYYNAELDKVVQEFAKDAGYSLTATLMGECKALGNSNGRRKHGQRVDGRRKPVEVIYRLSRTPSMTWAVGGVGRSTSQSQQLSLLGAV